MDLQDFERSGDILEDELNLYIGGHFYDCSFKVGATNPEVIKCHRLILARASVYFEKMFMSSFEESFRNKDDPIVITSTSPDVFDAAMRFIYGNAKEFKTIGLACEVYKLAHLWNMKSLMDATAEHLKNVRLHDVLQVYEMRNIMDTENQKELVSYCQEMISKYPDYVLHSFTWLDVTYSTVLEIFELDNLNIMSEQVLFDALMRWGAHNATSKGNSQIRAEIDSALKMVRFLTFSTDDFARISLDSNILSDREKVQIFTSISLNEPKHMPTDFSVCDKLREYEERNLQTLHSCLSGENREYYEIYLPQQVQTKKKGKKRAPKKRNPDQAEIPFVFGDFKIDEEWFDRGGLLAKSIDEA